MASASACSAEAPGPVPPESPSAEVRTEPGPAVRFSFTAVGGQPVSSESLRGRLTVVGLVTSYDPPSQSQALFLRSLARRHVPRLNVVLVVLEPEQNRPLVQAFADALDAPFAVVMADADTIAGRGAFGPMREVPSILVLDAESRERWRHVGQVEEQELERILRALEKGGASEQTAR